MIIKHASSSLDLCRCYAVMRELRPHLTEEEYLTQVKRQEQEFCYRTVYVEDNNEVNFIRNIGNLYLYSDKESQ